MFESQLRQAVRILGIVMVLAGTFVGGCTWHAAQEDMHHEK